jgi:hypothetical protein
VCPSFQTILRSSLPHEPKEKSPAPSTCLDSSLTPRCPRGFRGFRCGPPHVVTILSLRGLRDKPRLPRSFASSDVHATIRARRPPCLLDPLPGHHAPPAPRPPLAAPARRAAVRQPPPQLFFLPQSRQFLPSPARTQKDHLLSFLSPKARPSFGLSVCCPHSVS